MQALDFQSIYHIKVGLVMDYMCYFVKNGMISDCHFFCMVLPTKAALDRNILPTNQKKQRISELCSTEQTKSGSCSINNSVSYFLMEDLKLLFFSFLVYIILFIVYKNK